MTTPDTEWERLAHIVAEIVGPDGDLSLPSVLQRVVETARSTLGARYAAAAVLDDARQVADVVVAGPDDAPRARVAELARAPGLTAAVLHGRDTVRAPDLAVDAGAPADLLASTIRRRGAVLGVLLVTAREAGGSFTAEEEVMLAALANVAGVAVENERLHEHLRALALVGDRERIARDLHDKVVQRLFAGGILLQGIARDAEPAIARRIAGVVDEIDDAIREMRTSIFALGSGSGRGGGLRGEVRALVDELEPVVGADVTCRFDGPVDSAVPAAVADDLMAAMRELLTNVGKHAAATRADVTVSVAGGEVALRVRDDGRGPGPAPTGGRGLRNLAERARRHGGTFALSARKSGGAVADWRVPLHR